MHLTSISLTFDVMSIEKHEYEDDVVPSHVANFFREQARQKAIKALDDAEMCEVEPGQYFGPSPDFTPVNTTK